MEPNSRTGKERETLSRLDELAISSFSQPNNNSLYSDVDMDEANDEIFALPQFSRVEHDATSHDDSLVDSLAPPFNSLYISDDEEERKDMLHDFNNRDKKVQELILFNKSDFEMFKQSFNSSEEEWKRFLRVLYAKSEIVPNKEWFDTICEFISPVNPLLSKLKELAFNNNDDDNLHDETMSEIDFYSATPYQTSEIDYDGYSLPSTTTASRRESRDDDIMRFREVDIKTIRNYPEKLADFENAYPDFFTNARIYFGHECKRLVNHLQGKIGNTCNCDEDNTFYSITDFEGSFLSSSNGSNYTDYNEDFIEGLRANVEERRQACEDSDLYDHFVQILLASRRMIPDDLWEEAIYECLNDWPQLMVQLKDIIAYEVSNENIKESDFGDSQEIIVQL